MEQIIKIDNYKIFVITKGEGPPVLLLHSYWGSHLLFDQLTGELSGSRKVIRIDLPGHGASGNPPPGYRFESFAEVLNELLLRLNVEEKISVIGHSMGGYVALAFAALFPGRIESLVLMHSPVKNADLDSIRLRNREAALLRKGKKDLLLQVTIPSNFAPGNSTGMDEKLVLLNRTSGQVSTDGALRSIDAMNHRKNYLKTLQKSPYPILIIAGKYDKVYDAEGQIEDASRIPNAEALLLDHSGHMGFVEERDKVITRLKRFLA